MASLTVAYQSDRQDLIQLLQELRSPVDSSRFLFSNLSSLHVVVYDSDELLVQRPLADSYLTSVLQLLAANQDAFSSLRRLFIEDTDLMTSSNAVLSFSPLTALQALTHCRIQTKKQSASIRWSLLSALFSLPSLTHLDLSECEVHRQLWRLFTDAALPLLLRLDTLLLPSCYDDKAGMSDQHEAFCERLSSLPSPPALQYLAAAMFPPVTHSAAGLLSVFCRTSLAWT